jgi:methionyl-tRNA formyltransferase
MVKMDLKIVFMGSPEIAASILRKLVSKFPVSGVVTQPDKPAGRGRVMTSPPVKILSNELGIPVIQPARLRNPDEFDKLQQWAPDLIVVAAYGQILRPNVLKLPRYGCINVHASYLPRWRGAAPIQAAILNGDVFSGISIMLMDEGIDTGPVLAQQRIELAREETTASLSLKMAETGGDLLLKALPDYISGKVVPEPQSEDTATYAPMLSKEDGRIDLTQTAEQIERKIRALSDWPGAYMEMDSQVLKIRKAKLTPGDSVKPGQRWIKDGFPVITTAEGNLMLLEVQPAGKRWMEGSDFLRGTRNWESVNP